MGCLPQSSSYPIGSGMYNVINNIITGFGFLVASGFMVLMVALDRGLYFQCVKSGGLKHGPAADSPSVVTDAKGHCYSIARLASGRGQYLHKDVVSDADTVFWILIAAGAVAFGNFVIRWYLVRHNPFNFNRRINSGVGEQTIDGKDVLEVILAATTLSFTTTAYVLANDLLKRSHEAYKYFPTSTAVQGSISEAAWDAKVEYDTGHTLLVVALTFFSLNAVWKLSNLIGLVIMRSD